MKKGCLFVSLFLAAIVMLVYIVSSGSNNSASAPNFGASTQKIYFKEASCKQFCAIYGNKGTASEVQLDELFSKIKGQYVQWKGTVTEISKTFGSYTAQIKCDPNTFASDLIVTFRSGEEEALKKYSKGDTLSFEARLNRWSKLSAHSLDDGIVVQKKK